MFAVLVVLFLYVPLILTNTIPSETVLTFLNKKQIHTATDISSSCALFQEATPAAPLWSIMIPTVTCRKEQFEQLYCKLLRQIEAAGLQNEVEILFFRDDCTLPVGFKRNQLIEKAKGKYVSFVDDDDDVHERYVPMIYQLLLQDPDCVKLVGIFHWVGMYSAKFIHSIAYDSYFRKDGIYYRPPNHLNPIRRSIAVQFKFIDEKSWGEDTDWALRICKSRMVKTEASLEEPYYFYYFSKQTSLTYNKRTKSKQR